MKKKNFKTQSLGKHVIRSAIQKQNIETEVTNLQQNWLKTSTK